MSLVTTIYTWANAQAKNIESRMHGNGAPWYALIELPIKLAGVRGNRLQGEQLT